ncbi:MULTISPECIES: hypothetical protein [unclassified Nocardia]|uniref:hypothetical protein n=1 Tax=unclassified Nocardia TaxID=2637762 RepID=UPI0024A8D2CA|nr:MULTISPECIES: hypothetical protein [unclassified Nocardia]
MTDDTGHGPALRAKREAYDTARAELLAEIKAALDDGEGPSAIARDTKFTREYIAKIRDGKGPRS